MDEYLYQYVKYIDIHAKMDDIDILKWVSQFDVLIKFKDGRIYIYDTFVNMFRFIKYTSKELNEQEFKKEFGRRLQELMARRHVTQLYLADQLNTRQQMISRYINGESLPSTYITAKILDILNCTMDDLLFIPTILKLYL